MEHKSLKDIEQDKVNQLFGGDVEAKQRVDRDYEIDRLKKNIDEWQTDLEELNADLTSYVDTTADNVLFAGGNKTKVLKIFEDYNQYLFDYAAKADLVYQYLAKDQRALWSLERGEGD